MEGKTEEAGAAAQVDVELARRNSPGLAMGAAAASFRQGAQRERILEDLIASTARTARLTSRDP
jgi:hypothetical protein